MKKYFWIIPLTVLILAQIACGTSNSGTKVGEVPTTEKTAAIVATKAGSVDTQPQSPTATADSTASKEATKEPVQAEATPTASLKQQTYKIGDVIEVKDHRIRVNGAEYKGGVLKINLTVENAGTEDILVSSMVSFSAKMDDGTKLNQEIVSCGTSLDGKVLAGDKLKGDLCYKLATPGIVKVYYTSNLFVSGAVVWLLDTNNLTTVAEPTADPNAVSAIKTYKTGDIIELKGQKIVLNSAQITGKVLKANFTVENNGTEDIIVSSMLSFSVKAPDGTKLQQNLMSCSTSMIDGKVIAGDKVKGDICWDTKGLTGLKIYYDATLFGSGAIVWDVK